MTGIAQFFERMEQRMDQLLAAAPLTPMQRDLLTLTVERHRKRTRQSPVTDPLALFYLITRAERRELDEQGVLLGVFCQLYLLSLDLMDDVHDDDLAGKPHASAGPAIASNNALILLFLGTTALQEAMTLEPSRERALDYFALLNRVALLTGRGQHIDLVGAAGASTRAEVLDMQRAKTASLTLICECAASYSRVSGESRKRYRKIGESLSMLVQVLDDLRDIYGKLQSPDLKGHKMTYPLACFHESASPEEVASFLSLDLTRPDAVRHIRALFYSSGVVKAVALELEQQRRVIHQEAAALGSGKPALRTLLFIVDGLVSAVYTPQGVAESRVLFEPDGPWHLRVRELAKAFCDRMAGFGAPPTPRLVPWHLPQWVYEPRRETIFYPDLEGMPEETLSIQASLLGEPDLEKLRCIVAAQAPAVLAHELFHHFRHAAGHLTEDAWFEELAANSLSLAYCRQYEPAALAGGLALARAVRERPENALSTRAESILIELLDPERKPRAALEYGLELRDVALVQLAMVEQLSRAAEPLTRSIQRYLAA